MRELAGEALVERNYKKDPLTRAEADRVVRAAGSVEAVLNARHAIAKASGWKDAAPSRSAFVAALLKEPNLLRRPVIARGRRAIVSRDEAAIRVFLS